MALPFDPSRLVPVYKEAELKEPTPQIGRVQDTGKPMETSGPKPFDPSRLVPAWKDGPVPVKDNNAAVEERGFIGDTVSNIARGAKDLTEMVGYGLKTLDPDGGVDVVERAGQSLVDFSKKAESFDIMKQDKSEAEGEGLLSRGWKGGVRSAVPSLAPLAVGVGTGAAIGSFAGPVGTAVGGLIGGTAATLGLFGLGTYGQKKEEYQAQGIDEERAHKAALKQAFVEGGIEEVSNLLGLMTFGFGKVASQPLKQTAKELLSTPISTFAKNLAKNTFLNEVPTEMIQGALGAKIDENLGLLPEGEWQKQAVESIIPAMTMSVLFGVGAQGATSLHRNQIKNQLNSEDQQERVNAASYIAKSIDDKELRSAWIDMVDPLIQSGEPIDINADFSSIENADSKSDTSHQDITRKIANLEKRKANGKWDDQKEANLAGLKAQAAEIENSPEFKANQKELRTQRIAELEAKESNFAKMANPSAQAKANRENVLAELAELKRQDTDSTGNMEQFKADPLNPDNNAEILDKFNKGGSISAEESEWEAEIRNQQVDKSLKEQYPKFANKPDESYSDTIPFAEVPNAEESQWIDDIEQQKKGTLQTKINQARIDRTLSDIELEERNQNQSKAGKSDYLQKLDMMQQEVNSTRSSGVTQEKANQQGETIAFSSDSPTWMRQVQEDRKKAGQPALSRKDINTIIDKVRNNQPLTDRQQGQFYHIEKAIDNYTGESGEFVANDEAKDLEKNGFDLLGGQKMSVANLKQGDKFVGTVDGVKDEFEVKDTNEQGETLLQDGIAKRVDMFDEVVVDGIKRGKQADTATQPTTPTDAIQKTPNSKKTISDEAQTKGKNEISTITPHIPDSKESKAWQKPNVVFREFRDRNGNPLGYITKPYDGTKEDAQKKASEITNEADMQYPDWSNVNSRIGATDENSTPKYTVSPNFKHINSTKDETDQARYTWGDLEAGERLKTDEDRLKEIEKFKGYIAKNLKDIEGLKNGTIAPDDRFDSLEYEIRNTEKINNAHRNTINEITRRLKKQLPEKPAVKAISKPQDSLNPNNSLTSEQADISEPANNLTKDDIEITGYDKDKLSEKEWKDILDMANIGYQSDKRKTFKKSGSLILKNKNGKDTDVIYDWSVNKKRESWKPSLTKDQPVTWKTKAGKQWSGKFIKHVKGDWYLVEREVNGKKSQIQVHGKKQGLSGEPKPTPQESPVVEGEKKTATKESTTETPKKSKEDLNPLKKVGGVKGAKFQTSSATGQNQVDTEAFKKWFGNSKVIDDNGEPLVIYTGHSNVELFGSKLDQRKATAGAFYFTEDPKMASSYAMGKIGSKEGYQNGEQYRLKNPKTDKLNKKIWQYELTENQKRKIDELKVQLNEYEEHEYGSLSEMERYIEQNKKYDKDVNRWSMTGGMYNLRNIYEFYEMMGDTISYGKTDETLNPVERQNTNSFEDLLDGLGIKWQSYDWLQPGILPVYASLQNPLDTSKPFPIGLLTHLEEITKKKRLKEDVSDTHWTKDYPLKNWVEDIKREISTGEETFWATQVPKGAIKIFNQFGYDGIKDTGGKMGGDKHTVYIAFNPTQIKSAIGNNGKFSQTNSDIRYSSKPLTNPQEKRTLSKENLQSKEPQDGRTLDKGRSTLSNSKQLGAGIGATPQDRFNNILGYRDPNGTTKLIFPVTRATKQLRKVGNAFGKKIHFFTSKDPQISRINGVTNPANGNEIFINSESTDPLISIAGHELIHQLKANHPDLYDFLTNTIRVSDENFKKYVESVTKQRDGSFTAVSDQDVLYEEFIADFASDQFQRVEFWQKLLSHDKTFTDKIIDILQKILNKLSHIFPRAEHWVSNFKESQDALAFAMSEAVRLNGLTNAEKSDSKFSVKDTTGKAENISTGKTPLADGGNLESILNNYEPLSLKNPVRTVGYRYGKAPENGLSYNTRDNKNEKGVSLASAAGLPESKSFATMDAKNGRSIEYYEGDVIGYGGDDELIMSNVKSINKKIYLSKLSSENKTAPLRILADRLRIAKSVYNNWSNPFPYTGINPHKNLLEAAKESFASEYNKIPSPNQSSTLADGGNPFKNSTELENWFDPESDAVDENGDPLILYHSTNKQFTEFNPLVNDVGIHIGTKEAAETRAGRQGWIDRWDKTQQTDDYRLIRVNVSGKFFNVKDNGRWGYEDLLPELKKKGFLTKKDITQWENKRREILKKFNYPEKSIELYIKANRSELALGETHPLYVAEKKAWHEFIAKILKKKNLSGFSYNNAYEEWGKSYNVFFPDKIKIISPKTTSTQEGVQSKFQTPQTERTDTPAFREWFGDSVVTVDGKAGGEPLKVFHGTGSDFTAFDISKQAGGQLGKGFYFSPSPNAANAFSKIQSQRSNGAQRIIPAYLSIKNPYIFERRADIPINGVNKDVLANMGYDGVIVMEDGNINEISAFNPTQIKSVFNSGAWDASNPDIRYQMSQELRKKSYIENRKRHKDLKLKAVTSFNKLTRDIVKGVDKFLGSISTRLARISPKLSAKVQDLDFYINTKSANDLKIALPLLRKAKNMTSDDYADWDYARKNSDKPKIDELNKKYGIEKEYKAVREMLDRIREEAIDVGYDVGEIEDYWPRVLKDQEGFLRAIDKGPERPVFTDALKKKAKDMDITVDQMDETLKADIISNVILGKYYGIPGPGAVKHRVFEEIPVEFNKFYMDSDAALTNHIHSMRKRIEARRFFGKVPEKIATAKTRLRTAEARLRKIKDSGDKDKITDVKDLIFKYRAIIERYANQTDFKDNIGSYIGELLAKREISDSDQKVVKDILTARFNEHGTRGVIQAYKNLSYIDTMGSVTSAITQIGDLAWAAYEGGMIPALKHAYKAATGKSRITKEDVGVERIAQEFADADTLSNAVSKVFKIVGLEKMDSIGKEALLNTSFEKYKKEAAKEPEKLKAKIRHIFQGKTDEVIQDLLNDDVTENVKLLVYHRLINFQPVALSEMPEKYLSAGNGRLFYMLKTFTLKQFDIYRREVYHGLRHGNKSEKIQAMKNLTALTAMFVLANAGADELKDFILGRETDLEDRVVDNLLRLFGVSKFVTWKARTEGVGSAMARQILPPFKFIDAATKDLVTAGDEKGIYSIGSVPVVGKLAYWHMGRGKKSRGERWDRKFSKEKKHLNKVKDKLETSKDKRKFRMDNRADLVKLNKANSIQGSLNKYKKQINKLKSMPSSKRIEDRIIKLEGLRTTLIMRYFGQKEK